LKYPAKRKRGVIILIPVIVTVISKRQFLKNSYFMVLAEIISFFLCVYVVVMVLAIERIGL